MSYEPDTIGPSLRGYNPSFVRRAQQNVAARKRAAKEATERAKKVERELAAKKVLVARSCEKTTLEAKPAQEVQLTDSISSRAMRRACFLWGISKEQLIGQRRTADIVEPRMVAAAIICRITTLSLPQVGKIFGGRDHTTILNATKKMAPLIGRIAAKFTYEASPEEWVEAAFYDLHGGE